MKLIYGSLWDNISPLDLILVPASRTLDRTDKVLAYSSELQKTQEIFPDFLSKFGKELDGSESFYGLLTESFLYKNKPVSLGLFQVHTHFRNSYSLNLFKLSIEKLNLVSNQFSRICLSFPVGFLSCYKTKELIPLLEMLPENCVVWVPLSMKPKKQKKFKS